MDSPALVNLCCSVACAYRDGRIRTGDPLNPIQVRYRAAPRPVKVLLPAVKPFLGCGSSVLSARWVRNLVRTAHLHRASLSSAAPNTTANIVSVSACW